MKLAKLIDERAHEALSKLSKEPLPLKTAFKLKGVMRVVREEFTKYEEVRKDALQRHGDKADNGELKIDERGNVQFTTEGINAFVAELSELASIDIDIPTLSLSELDDKITLSAEELEALDGILVEG